MSCSGLASGKRQGTCTPKRWKSSRKMSRFSGAPGPAGLAVCLRATPQHCGATIRPHTAASRRQRETRVPASIGSTHPPSPCRRRSNRAAAHLKLGVAAEALADAERAVQLRAGWDKAHFRRGSALEMLGKLEPVSGVECSGVALQCCRCSGGARLVGSCDAAGGVRRAEGRARVAGSPPSCANKATYGVGARTCNCRSLPRLPS